MKRLTYIGIIMAMGILICAANLLAGPQDYLASEGSSYGLSVSKEMKQEEAKVQAREDRLLLYQAAIDNPDSYTLELQAVQAENVDEVIEAVDYLGPIGDSLPSGIDVVDIVEFNEES
jgi:hypothetical protein